MENPIEKLVAVVTEDHRKTARLLVLRRWAEHDPMFDEVVERVASSLAEMTYNGSIHVGNA